jgi:hypothetical protein
LGTSLMPMSTRAKRYVSLDRNPEPEVRSSDSVRTCPSGETLPRPSPHVTSSASSILPPDAAAMEAPAKSPSRSRATLSTQALLELALNFMAISSLLKVLHHQLLVQACLELDERERREIGGGVVIEKRVARRGLYRVWGYAGRGGLAGRELIQLSGSRLGGAEYRQCGEAHVRVSFRELWWAGSARTTAGLCLPVRALWLRTARGRESSTSNGRESNACDGDRTRDRRAHAVAIGGRPFARRPAPAAEIARRPRPSQTTESAAPRS